MNPTIEHIASILGRDAFLAACCGIVVAALAFLITRIPGLSATTRHAVWVLAIVALGAMPLAAIGQSALEGRVIEHRPAGTGESVGDDASRFRADTFAPPRNGLLKRVVISLGRSHPRLANAVAASTHPTLPSLANHPRIAAVARFVPLAFLAAWIVGACIGLGFLTASLLRVVGLKRRSSPLSEELSTQLPWLTDGTGREIMLRLSFEIETPVAVGFRRPVVLIPTELVDENGLGQIEELVQHEYAHLRRYDDWTNLVQRVVERVFWWNPVVALVGRRIALEREIAADDCVVASGAAPQRYAQSLWRLAREMRMPEHSAVAPGALFTRKQITIRIEQLLNDRRNARPRVAPGAMVAAAGLVFVGIVAVVTTAPAFEITRELPAVADVATPEPEPSAPAMRLLVLHDPTPAPEHPAHTLARRVTVIATVTPLATATGHPQNDRKTIAYSYTVDANDPTAPPMTVVPSAPPAPAAPSAPPLPIAAPSPGANDDPSSAREQISRASKSLVAAVLRDALGSTASGPHGRGGDSLANCNGCDLSGRSFRGRDLHGITLYGADLSSADLRDANLQGAHLNGVDLSSANLDNADLRGAVLTGVDLSSTSMRNVKIDGLHMNGATLDGTNFQGVPMRALLESCAGCNFSNFDFHGADLHGVQLHGLNLSDTNFSGANLRGAVFAGANLDGANFDNADLRDASFAGSNLHDASFDGARIDRTTFAGSRPPH